MPVHRQYSILEISRRFPQFIKIEDAARLLAVSKSWIYQRRETLPFVVKLPDGPLRVSVSKLRKWLQGAK